MTDYHAPKGRETVYDLAVIGAGSAGFSAAITAADQGANVALIGHGTIGGTCVNVGCVPSKTMIRAAEALHGARAAARFPGVSGNAQVDDWHSLIAAKDDLVSDLRQRKYVDLLPEYDGITYLEGAARLDGAGVIVGDEPITAGKIIIATGGRPSVPPIPGIETVNYLTSTSLLDLQELPRSLIVVGGGYVGAELAQMMARMGVDVTMVCRSRLLPQVEPQVSEALAGIFRSEGMTLYCGIAYDACREDERGVMLCVQEGGRPIELKAERLLVATGRTPNTEGLGLEEAGIARDARGAIVVDNHMRTSKADIYAAGDVTNRDQFVYMAAYGAKLAALNALNGDSLTYDNATMPWVVFTDPQLAGVGLSEAAAKSAGFETKTSILPLDLVPRALAARDTRGLVKLVADAGSDLLLGGQIIAPEGADSIQTLALALRHGMTVAELGETIFPYLTTVEALKLAAQGFGKDVTKLYCCAG
ncbi:mercury(II) reductase [Sphingopyxis alaskensis]|jgi:mercuric reductase|uniref:Mercuric reductase n=1 Tax=Sphingopyxis alaskensis (strain DSM 13593 / LMG 18877 / RB2256) TaxID=317655 RepID=Q1GPN4_SPHAL|nr:mercury(II) reductase [Sphingopyxis alaskensis]ABF54388.1 Mercuric reductase MerA [Sphingopyxis alaskensis RB2256]